MPQNYWYLHNPTIMQLLKNNKKDAEKKCVYYRTKKDSLI